MKLSFNPIESQNDSAVARSEILLFGYGRNSPNSRKSFESSNRNESTFFLKNQMSETSFEANESKTFPTFPNSKNSVALMCTNSTHTKKKVGDSISGET